MGSREPSPASAEALGLYSPAIHFQAARYVLNYRTGAATDAQVIERFALNHGLNMAEVDHLGSKSVGNYTHVIFDYKNPTHSPRVTLYAFDSGLGSIVVSGALRHYVLRKARLWVSIKRKVGALIPDGEKYRYKLIVDGQAVKAEAATGDPESSGNSEASTSLDASTGPATSPSQEEVSATEDLFLPADVLQEMPDDELYLFQDALPAQEALASWGSTPRAPMAVMEVDSSVGPAPEAPEPEAPQASIHVRSADEPSDAESPSKRRCC